MLVLATNGDRLHRLHEWLAHYGWIPVWLTGLGTLGLAVGVVVAVVNLWDSRKTRDGQLVIELSQRWNERETRRSREAYSGQKPGDIVALIDQIYPKQGTAPDHAPDPREVARFQQLVRWPSLIETIGVLWDHGSISGEAIFKMWGYSIAGAWETWREPAMVLRDRAAYPGTFEFFQALAKEMNKQARKKAAKDAKREELRLY